MKTIAALIAIAGIASVTAVASAQTAAFNGTPLFVPDSPAPAVTIDTNAFTGTGVIQTVSCTMDWNPGHTFAGDLVIQLTFTPTNGSPAVTADLTRRRGGSSDWAGVYTFTDGAPTVFATNNLVGPPGAYQASTTNGAAVSLNTTFAGLPVAGTWTLTAQDFAGLDTGTIDSASVTVVGGTAPVPPSGISPTFNVVRNPALPGPFSGLLTVATTGGFNPPSTVTGVRANLTSLLGPGHTSDQLFDNGTNGDVTAGDGIYSRTVTPLTSLADGTYAIPFVVSDNRTPPRTGTGTGAARLSTILGPAGATNLGTITANTEVSGSADAEAGQAAWFRFTSTTDATDPGSFLDAYVLSNTGYADTYMALFDVGGNFLVSDDDGGAGLLSQLSFGRTDPSRTHFGSDPAAGADGPLAAGTYYIAVVQYFSTFSSPFGFSNTATGATTATVGITSSNQAPASIDPTITARFTPATFTNTSGGPGGPVTRSEVLLSATVVNGRFPTGVTNTVTADLQSAGLGTSSAAQLFDDGTNGDLVAGDNIYSRTIPVTGVAPGSYTVTVSLVDDQNRTASASPTLTRNEDQTILTLDAGTLPFTGTFTTYSNTQEIVGREVNWVRFIIAAGSDVSGGGTRFVDIDTNGSTMDTHIGLFAADGTFLNVSDDDDGAGLQSALSFGSVDPTGRDTNPAGAANNGRDGELPSGTYYLALNFYPATYGSPFIATTTSTGIGGTYVINITSGDQNGTTPPPCVADINGDNVIDGTDFTLFINSFSLGDVSIDSNADVAGGIPFGGDGTIDGTDYIAFIAAFSAGC